jgi:hypothetical protein
MEAANILSAFPIFVICGLLLPVASSKGLKNASEEVRSHPFLPHLPVFSVLSTGTLFCSVSTVPMRLDASATLCGRFLVCFQVCLQQCQRALGNLCFLYLSFASTRHP